MMPRLTSLFALALVPFCIWDTDTMRDEAQSQAGLFDLITGQFPHHGRAYYEHRIERLERELLQHDKDIVRRNDYAVALLKLGRFEESKREFARIEAVSPGKYETLSNLGVLHKKSGDYAKAADYLKRALKIKPEGHLGVGDVYLKEMEYLARAAGDAPRPSTSFLGIDYLVDSGGSDEFHPHLISDEEELLERVRKLIHADREFADGLLVLGDALATRFDLNLALWAYLRARHLGHRNDRAVQRRIDYIFDHWRQAVTYKGGKIVEPQDVAVPAILADLKKADAWVQQFEAVEAELCAKLGPTDDEVDFDAVKAEMQRRGISRLAPTDHGIKTSVFSYLSRAWPWIVAGVPLVWLYFWVIRPRL